MVKFAQRLDTQRFPSWAEHYVDYRALKALVYEAKTDGTREDEFMRALGEEIQKVRPR